MLARRIISTHPNVKGHTNESLIQCVEACYDCAPTCTACTDACLGEQERDKLVKCIRLSLDCADICLATGALSSRRSGSNEQLLQTMLDACAQACRLCADECGKHASHHEHCRICTDACRACVTACEAASQSIGTVRH